MTFFSVKNFAKFQHYKDRSPPWIKLYNELLDDYEFGLLPDASKMHLIAIWLLASRSDNKIPFDSEWVARRINATEPVNLMLLAEKEFILTDQPLQTVEHVASKPLAKCLSREEGEESRGEKKKEDGASAPLALVPIKEQPDPERDYFRRVREVVGQKEGGPIGAKLLKAKSGKVSLARSAIEQASEKQKPVEYIFAIINKTDEAASQRGMDPRL